MNNRKKKKEAQRKKRRLFLAILMILFVGVVLTASTYAWFTANQTVTVSDINVTVSASDGIQISVDGADWRALVTNEDIRGALSTYSGAHNQIPTSMVPVSTVKDIDTSTGFMNMYLGRIAADSNGINKLNSTKTTEDGSTAALTSAGDFVVFDLFFKVTSEKEVYLTNNSKVTSTSGKGIENAARIAFVPEGTTSANSTISTIQGKKDATKSGVILWEPNNNAHTQAGINNASSVYLYDGLEEDGELVAGHHAVLTASGDDAVVTSYYGLKNEFTNSDLNAKTASLFEEVTPTLATGTAGILNTNYLEVFTLQPGITKMRIYMWIEGQDVDCEDAASGSNLTYSLQFSILKNINDTGGSSPSPSPSTSTEPDPGP